MASRFFTWSASATLSFGIHSAALIAGTLGLAHGPTYGVQRGGTTTVELVAGSGSTPGDSASGNTAPDPAEFPAPPPQPEAAPEPVAPPTPEPPADLEGVPKPDALEKQVEPKRKAPAIPVPKKLRKPEAERSKVSPRAEQHTPPAPTPALPSSAAMTNNALLDTAANTVGGVPSGIPGQPGNSAIDQHGGSGTIGASASPDYLRNPPPRYPESARRRGAQGVVVLLVEINPEGRVSELSLKRSSGYQILDEAAESTVRRWRFKPAVLAGVPISDTVEVPIRFQLRRHSG